jgi:DNA polymerase III sliding clamp (beta) subunit (PCNA family)
MLEILKFVKAAVGDDEPLYRHFFQIRGGRITATNGRMAIQAPIPLDLDCCPHAGQFIKAIAACDDMISLSYEAGRLLVRSGRLKIPVALCDPATFPDIRPEGQIHPIPAPLLPIFRRLLPFVSTDDARPWYKAIKFVNQSAYATNNISVVEHYIPVNFPVIATIPADAIRELVRMNLEPHSIQAEPHKVTFHLPGGAWVACMVTAERWADFERFFSEDDFKGPWMEGETLQALLADVGQISKFTDDYKRVRFRPGKLETVHADAPGTVLECPQSPGSGCFNTIQLAALEGVEKVGWAAYPRPVPFRGPGFRGIMAGLIDPESR